MKNIIKFCLTLIIAIPAIATQQIQDKLVYQGEIYQFGGYSNFPLEKYFNASTKEEMRKWHNLRMQKNTENGMTSMSPTSCYRGHVASWKIDENALVLTGLRLKLKSEDLESVEVLNPFFGDKIQDGELIAFWFNGHITLRGKDEILFFENGKLIKIQKFEYG